MGHEKLAAVIEAAGTRLRPILMTTAATVFGHLPLIFAGGPGAGARNSIGIMLVSGMIIGTIFTLFVVPAIYMLIGSRHHALDVELLPEPVPVAVEAEPAVAVH
jgi:multidrug efflux pump